MVPVRKTSVAISIVMPVYNAAAYLGEAIHSILSQSLRDWELVIVDDCSTDNSAEIVASFRDERIRFFHLTARSGVSRALNYGISFSRSEFIGRMDADDICVASRFEKQLTFLTSHPEIALVGSALKTFPSPEVIWKSPGHHEEIRLEMMFRNPIYHSTVVFRRAAFETLANGYRQEFEPAEDFDLWERMSRNFKVANVPEILVRYRRHGNQASLADPARRLLVTRKIKQRAADYLGLTLPPDEINLRGLLWLLTFWVQVIRKFPSLKFLSLYRGVSHLLSARRPTDDPM